MTSQQRPPEPDFGEDPEAYRKAVADAEREIYRHLQHLHDDGLLDLDAPARAVVDVLDREYPRPPRRVGDEAAGAVARAGGYWLVGSEGWCNHL